jgi:hypothetical protein
MKGRYILVIFVILALVSGCAKPPTEEMDSARGAVFMATNDPNAVQYAGSTLSRARDSIRLMDAEADSKRYDTAKIYAQDAKSLAEKAIADGKTGAARARDEAASALSSLRREIDDTSRNVEGARNSRLNLNYKELDSEIGHAYEVADQAQDDQAQGRYLNVMNKTRSVRSDLFAINQKISGAVTRRK